MLAAQGILDAGLAERICAALEAVEIEADASDEDVHSAIERELGELGRRVHAGRSRNDQVQTAMRLWVKGACGELQAGIRGLAGALLDRAELDGTAVLPGYTHLQRAQPVWLGHHLAAHVWALERDVERLHAAHRRADACPSEPARWPGRACRSTRRRWRRSSASRPCTRTRWTPSPTATTASSSCSRARSPSRTCRASPRSSCCGRRRSSGSPSSTTPRRPARR